ncbi:response regulator transcription factor [Cohnella hashimotonis]|uniref:Response regulator n=1 Tax=Cohnella hashimotonis TaxID=2826895 RepID=A0ABT6TQD8_9BACL|nr:response regulator [Cohnella hashimotonis]MDI4648443.1 response regulator [Cohnella hashimotonis]
MYNVLIVDDEAVQREYLREVIPSLDPRFTVAGEAADGEEALAWLAAHAADVLVTDIKMPVMDGLALCRIAYEQYPRMRRVILSGHEEFEYVREALVYKAEQYLLKPPGREAVRLLFAGLADDLERERGDARALRGLQSLSEEGRMQVGRRLLQALIAGAEAEIGTLFPLAYRMKIPLFEGEGLLLLLAIDESSMREQGVAPHERSLFDYILNQVTAELAQSTALAWTLFDSRERTAVLLSGTDPQALSAGAEALFGKIRQTMRDTAGLTLTGGASSLIEDVQQLDAAYAEAHAAVCRKYLEGGDTLYASGDGANSAADAFDTLVQAASAELSDPYGDRRAAYGRPALDALLPNGRKLDAACAYGLVAALLGELQRLAGGKRHSGQWAAAWQALDRAIPAGNPAVWTATALADACRSALAPLTAAGADPEPRPAFEAAERQLALNIRAYIDANYAEPISLALLSDKFRASQQHISTIFHKHAGTPYIRYMTRVRMDNAARLLSAHPDMKIFEVAERTGYANVKHFSYVFKKHFGVTPGEYGARE